MPHKDPEARRAYMRQWTKDNRERRRWYMLEYTYGVTKDQYEAMAKAQRHRCAVCNVQPTDWLVVDHCHDGGQVRGLLCSSCNKGLGHLKDDPGIMQAAIEYLTPSNVLVDGAGI